MCKTAKDQGEPQKRQESANRAKNGQFGKGNCANPGGRPKEAAEIKELARQHGEHVIARLAVLADSDDERTAVAACRELLDRGYGRAMQGIELTGANGGPIEYRDMTTDQLKALLAQQMAAK